jgi:bacteriocin leader peptide (microcyclamide/patellamide family)
MLDNGTKPTNYNMEKTLMNQQNLMPQAAQPVTRITTGQLPTDLAELSEEILGADASAYSANVLASGAGPVMDLPRSQGYCSYDGDDAE